MDGGVIATVVGGILGFIASVLPEIIGLFRSKLNPSATPVTARVTAIVQQPEHLQPGEVTDGEATTVDDDEVSSYAADVAANIPITYAALDFVRTSVRPVLTYSFFIIFIYIKIVLLRHALYVDGSKVIEIAPIVWDEGTEALFAAVLAFWFGSRAFGSRTKSRR